ncbi:MAG: MG2 domain-containing protein, partial [Persicimonas sp.]
MRSHRFWLVLLSAAILLAGCSDKKNGRDDDTHAAADADGEFAMEHDDGEEGLRFSLREAEEPDEDAVRPRTVTGEPLGERETATLLGRLPALPDEDEAQTEFAFRKRSKPAPRTGETVETAFPPEQQRELTEADDDAPFEVARFAPEGEIPLAPKLSVSFSKPVVAVSGQEDAAKTQPASIEPDVPGSWRWVGTRTALFEPDGERFPMATDYTVSVPKELESARGDRLEEAVEWTFETPALEISRAYPSGQLHERAPVLFLEFNQRVEPAELVDHIVLRADGRDLGVRLATDDQIAADETVRSLVDRAREDHWIALRPADAFPPATDVQLGLAKGAPSAEGPKRTGSEQLESFRTYEKLRLERHSCPAERPCQPLTNWYTSFNNPLDEDAFSPDMIRVEPELGDFDAEVRHSQLYIRGQSQPRTTYEVTFDAAIQDKLGQTLGEDVTRTFHVGKAPPRLGSSAGVLTVLDPAADGRFPVFSVNHESMRVRAFEVEPSDWHAYLSYLQNRYRDESARPPGKNVLDTEVDIDAEADQFTQTGVDLNEALDDNGHGQLVVVIEPTDTEDKSSRRRGHNAVVTWLQGTDIALDAFSSRDRLLTWTSALDDGAPLEDVEVSLLQGDDASSDASGLAELELPDKASDQRGQILVAQGDDDIAILPESFSMWGGGRSNWVQRDVALTVLWHVFDDRGIYKPGETVHIKGWARRSRVGQTPKLDAVAFERVKYQVRGPRGNTLAEGTTVLSDAGGFDFEIDLPDDVNLGSAHISLSPTDSDINGQTGHSFQIQEFRRPEFEVDVTKQAGPHVVGQKTTLGAEASYYAGGGLAGAPVNWTVTSRTGQYTPPNRDDYIFGRWQPWWIPSPGGDSRSESFSGHTDAAGKHHLEVSFDSARPPLPSVVEASSAVTDVNRQTWSADTSMLVHPSQAYVGLRTKRNFVERGEPFDVEAIVADIDGDLVAQRPVEVSAMRLEWRMKNGKWQEVESDQTTCDLTSADEAKSCTFTPEKGGTWRLRAVVRDERGRPNMTEMKVWVAGGQMPPNRRAEKQEVELIPDKETYEAGDTAEILVQAPFADAEALLTIRQNGVVSKERFTIDGQSHTLEIPLEEAHYPN